MPEFDVFGDAFFDISVINICAASYIKRASKGVLEGRQIRYEEKGHISSRTNKKCRDVLNAILTDTSFCLQRNQGAMLVRRCLGMI